MANLFKQSLIVTAVCAALVGSPSAQAEASKEEAIGFGAGAVIGAIVGGPVGFIVGAAGGALIGNEIHESEAEQEVDPFASEEFTELQDQLNEVSACNL